MIKWKREGWQSIAWVSVFVILYAALWWWLLAWQMGLLVLGFGLACLLVNIVATGLLISDCREAGSRRGFLTWDRVLAASMLLLLGVIVWVGVVEWVAK